MALSDAERDAALLKALAATQTNWDKADPEITYNGKMITLPEHPTKMSLGDAIKTLQRKQKDEETVTQIVEWVDTHPFDGAAAFSKAMKRKYGWASGVPTPGFFGPTPPVMLGVRVGPEPNDVIQVPWGRFNLPGVKGDVNTGAKEGPNGIPQFILYGNLMKKDHDIVKELAAMTRDILKTESIYKGKAIRLRTDAEGNINYQADPEFLHTKHVEAKDLILNPGEGEQIQTALWTPIFHTQKCIDNKIPLKRGVLLEGPYGCGKTMVSSVTSRFCVDNKWTFIALDDVRALGQALEFARRYAPAVVFAEDIDRAASKRDQKGNDLLNVIDGILSKDSQVITCLTTNFVEVLDRAMLRPGRLDAVISVRPPDAISVVKLVKVYARSLLHHDADLTDVGEELAGQIPATIREVVERSKLAMIARGGATITASDLLHAAKGMKHHLSLLNPKPAEPSPGEVLRAAIHEAATHEPRPATEHDAKLKTAAERIIKAIDA